MAYDTSNTQIYCRTDMYISSVGWGLILSFSHLVQIVVDQSCNGDIGPGVGPLVQVLSVEETTYLPVIAQMKLYSLDSFLLCKTIVKVELLR